VGKPDYPVNDFSPPGHGRKFSNKTLLTIEFQKSYLRPKFEE